MNCGMTSGLQTFNFDDTTHSDDAESKCKTSVTPTACSPLPIVAQR